MKKITTLIVLAFAGINFCTAQTHFLYGTCYSGGAANWGAIFQANLDGSNLHTAYSFQNPEGAMPWGKIAQASNGKIYGVTFLGGCADSCTLYEYDPIAGTCLDVYDFYCNTPVSEPSQNGLIILPDGKIYGLEQNGIIYKFDPDTHVYTLLNQTTGGSYVGGLMQASNGKLYGPSSNGGVNNLGSIFSYDLATQTYSVLYSFDGTHGSYPYYENLVQATDGKLYGTTYQGGANGFGVIFSYDISTNVYTDLYDFIDGLGKYPYAGLIQASNGKLYGTTYQGGANNQGVIFSYDIAAAQYSAVHSFDGINGANPQRGLTQASSGILFGTTYGGGVNNVGTAYSFDIASSTFTKIADFNSTTGSGPECDIQEMVVSIETGITSANILSRLIYIDAYNQLVIRNSELGKGEVSVYDALGKNVFRATILNQKSEFDLSSFQRGIYFVQLKSNAGLITQKIILTK